LKTNGYHVRELPFEYSAAVGTLGTPVAGLVTLLVIGAASAASLGNHPALALAVLLAGFLTVAFVGRWIATRGVLALPLMRRRGVNLEAWRGDEEPGAWLVAHIDSKSQPIPLLLRAAGIVALILASIVAIVVVVSANFGYSTNAVWPYVGIMSIAGALPVLASVVGRSSPGAVDNASGVGTVLCAAAILPPEEPIGVLITDAEELGLAGARAWCAETTRPRVPVLNCDGIDDNGQLTLMWTRPRSPRLEHVVRDAAARQHETLRVIPLVPGVLVDALAFSDAGWEAVTLSRGSFTTLRRIHTRGDSLDHLQGRGLSGAALTVALAASSLTERC